MYRALKQLGLMLFLGVACYPLALFALYEDKKATVYIVADSTIYNYKTGVKIYQGNVKVDQGTTHLLADRLVTKNNKQHIMQEAIAYGDNQRAHYWTLSKVGEPEIHALAKIIKFYPIESNVVLEQRVVVTQGENRFEGELILYNGSDQTITVPASTAGRAVVVYNPDN